MTDYNKELISFLYKSPTAFHAISSIKKKLVASGYSELAESEKWELTEGGSISLLEMIQASSHLECLVLTLLVL